MTLVKHHCTMFRNPEVVRALVDRRANIHTEDNQGRTPIQITERRANSYHRPIITTAYVDDMEISDILRGAHHLIIKCHRALSSRMIRLNAAAAL